MKFKAEAGANDSKNYIKLKDKESISGIFMGDPYEFKAHWNGSHDQVCSEDGSCSLCLSKNKPRFRFRINFIVKEGDSYVAKVFEQGWNVYISLKGLHEGDYDLEKYVMKISRSGSGQNDTTYAILPIPKGELSPSKASEIKNVVLQDLSHKEVSQTNSEEQKKKSEFVPEPAFDSDDEIPF